MNTPIQELVAGVTTADDAPVEIRKDQYWYYLPEQPGLDTSLPRDHQDFLETRGLWRTDTVRWLARGKELCSALNKKQLDSLIFYIQGSTVSVYDYYEHSRASGSEDEFDSVWQLGTVWPLPMDTVLFQGVQLQNQDAPGFPWKDGESALRKRPTSASWSLNVALQFTSWVDSITYKRRQKEEQDIVDAKRRSRQQTIQALIKRGMSEEDANNVLSEIPEPLMPPPPPLPVIYAHQIDSASVLAVPIQGGIVKTTDNKWLEAEVLLQPGLVITVVKTEKVTLSLRSLYRCALPDGEYPFCVVHTRVTLPSTTDMLRARK
jgi:hypothetical protein